MTTHKKRIALIGFGSQGKAWAHCLKKSGYEVSVYLNRGRESPSFEQAAGLGFSVYSLPEISKHDETSLIAFLCPDREIGKIYQTHFAENAQALSFVLAHGYAVYSKELAVRANHEILLFAPKAIGPKIQSEYDHAKLKSASGFHDLKVAVSKSATESSVVSELAQALGFQKQNCILASFDEETIGDLISEQGLLCGGVFTLLIETARAMKKARIPERLIREECVSELYLIADLLRKNGPEATFLKISEAAQVGTVLMRDDLLAAGLSEVLEKRFQKVVSHEFVREFNAEKWRDSHSRLKKELSELSGSMEFSKGEKT